MGYSLVGDIIRGVQDQGIIANAKHWVDNNQETNRNTVDSHVDERTQHEIYYTPFEGAIEAGVGSFMCSYNKINGFWSCENAGTLGDLKGELGFTDGWVMSDWGATHSTSINQGLDQEMPGSVYMGKALLKALEEGTVSMDAVDNSVLRILTPMFAIGVMDEGTPRGDKANDVTSAEHTELAAEISAASHVLLKNKDTLPLSKDRPMKIAVIGHMARQPIIGGGGSGQVFPKETISPYNGIAAALGVPVDTMTINCTQTHKDFGYEQPSCIAGMKVASPEKCSELCASSDNCYYWSFEANRCAFTPTKMGIKPLPGGVSGHCERKAPAAGWSCSASSSCVATSDAQGDNLAEAEQLVKEADVAIVVIGTSSGEGHDREDLTFSQPANLCQLEPEESQDNLVSLVAKWGAENQGQTKTKIVVAMTAPGAVLTPWRDEVDALLHGFMPGQAYGRALANVLFGDVNPSGRLPMTMPNKENEVGFTDEQYPGIDKKAVYTEGLLVDYRWYTGNGVIPAYPFGHGLSYTTFTYSSMTVEKVDKSIKVTLTLTNSGSVAGRDVPQLYVTFPPEAQEPPLHLKGFRRTELLSAEESTTVEFVLRERDVSVWDVSTHGWKVVEGEYKISVGASSADLRESATIKL